MLLLEQISTIHLPQLLLWSLASFLLFFSPIYKVAAYNAIGISLIFFVVIGYSSAMAGIFGMDVCTAVCFLYTKISENCFIETGPPIWDLRTCMNVCRTK